MRRLLFLLSAEFYFHGLSTIHIIIIIIISISSILLLHLRNVLSVLSSSTAIPTITSPEPSSSWMGQSPSSPSRRDLNLSHRFKHTKSMVPPNSSSSWPTHSISSPTHDGEDRSGSAEDCFPGSPSSWDFISDLPDECLACIFHSLGSGDRKSCSLVCRRWLLVEGQSRHRLSLNAKSDLHLILPNIFDRFDSVTKLALKCDRRSVSVSDESLILISSACRNLTRLKLRACREITDQGISALAKNCKGLKKLSCGSCTFGAKGMNALVNNCSSLEELSVKRLRGITDGPAAEPVGPGLAAASLRVICLKELYNGQCFGPLIIGSKNLRTLKLFRCSGDWNKLFEGMIGRVNSLVEVHFEKVQVNDVGLAALGHNAELEILHLVKTPECTNLGLRSIAERCKLLRKLHVDGWKANRIGDEGLIAVGRSCPNLQELVLIGVNPTNMSLDVLASSCANLERLALCGSDTVGDAEISCIAAKCVALRKLCIKNCPISDIGMEALAAGCPNLVKVKVKKCKAVTNEFADWLRSTRATLAVNLDSGELEQQDASADDGGIQNGIEFPPQVPPANIASGSAGRSASIKARLGALAGRNLASTFRRWSSFSHSSSRQN